MSLFKKTHLDKTQIEQQRIANKLDLKIQFLISYLDSIKVFPQSMPTFYKSFEETRKLIESIERGLPNLSKSVVKKLKKCKKLIADIDTEIAKQMKKMGAQIDRHEKKLEVLTHKVDEIIADASKESGGPVPTFDPGGEPDPNLDFTILGNGEIVRYKKN